MTRPARHPDWQARLTAWLAEAARTPFRDGVHDCALFAAGGVAAMTGTDPAARFRGRYTTLRGGLRVLRHEGLAGNHIDLTARLFEAIPPAFARPGDLAAVTGDDGPALGIVQGEMIYVLRRDGLGLVPLLSASTAFRVP